MTDDRYTTFELAHHFAAAYNASQHINGPQAMNDDEAADIIADLRVAGFVIEYPRLEHTPHGGSLQAHPPATNATGSIVFDEFLR